MTVKNNLWFNCSDIGMIGGTTTVDYNSYLNSNQSAVGSHDISTSSVIAPFVISTNVRLTTENAAWENRTSLGAPYDTLDLYGNPFSNDRGASEVGGAVPSPPINLTGTLRPLRSVLYIQAFSVCLPTSARDVNIGPPLFRGGLSLLCNAT